MSRHIKNSRQNELKIRRIEATTERLNGRADPVRGERFEKLPPPFIVRQRLHLYYRCFYFRILGAKTRLNVKIAQFGSYKVFH